jgi:cell division protein FtsL
MAVIGARPATRSIGITRRPRSRPRPVAHHRVRSVPRRRARPISLASLLVTIAAMATLGLFYLSQSTHVAAVGYQIDRLEQRVADLQSDQQQLLLQIGQAQSPTVIQERATSELKLVPLRRSAIGFAPTSTDPTVK